MGMLDSIRKRNPSEKVWRILFYDFWRMFCFTGLRLFYDFRVLNVEKFPATGPLLLVSNHQSHLDPPAVGVALPRHAYFIARLTLFNSKIFGNHIRLLNAIPIDQSKGDLEAIRTVLSHLQRGRPIVVFAEGSRSHDGGLNEFKSGTSLILKRAKVPVLPVAIEGAFDAWPRTRKAPRYGGHVWVKYGDLISYDELKSLGRGEAILEHLKSKVEDLRMELRAEIREATKGQHPAPGPGDYRYDDPDAPAREPDPWSVKPAKESKLTSAAVTADSDHHETADAQDRTSAL